MERRIFIAIGISIAFLWIWAALAPRFFPQMAKPKPTPSAKSPSTALAPAPESEPGRRPVTEAAVPKVAPAQTAPVADTQVRYTVVENHSYLARFSNRGAQLVSFQLKRYLDKNGKNVELVKARDPRGTDYPFFVQSESATVSALLNSALYVVNERVDRGVKIIEYRFAAPDGLSATKTFRIWQEYLIDVTIKISPPVRYRVMIGPGIRTLSPEEEDSKVLVTGHGVVQRDGDLKIVDREKGDRLQIFDSAEYIGIEDNYFLTVLKPAKGGPAVLHRTQIRDNKGPRKEWYAGVTAVPDGSLAGTSFFGPKETKLLDRYGLGEALQFGMFGIIARFLLEVLVWINQYTKNYGFAIIVLTILIKIVLYPLQHKSIVSMKKMQRVQPKTEAIKNKYKKARTDPEQRQKMNVEMMKLYQVEGINPMSGCIPILLQLPILWGFYGLLSRAIELRGAPWILWIKDLSEKDPTYILPILMTATMFIQTYITPMTGDPMQRRMFLAMPIVFGFIFKDFPSGLVLYWLVQNVLTIVQQMIMNKWWKQHPDELQKT